MVVTLPEPYKPRNDFERDYFEGKEAVPFHEKCLYVVDCKIKPNT